MQMVLLIQAPRMACNSLQACSIVNQSKVYIPAEGRIECIRVVSLVCLQPL